MCKGLFITATGTDVGKTFATSLLVKKLRQAGYSAGYYKAALSGAEWRYGVLVPGDADYVKRVANLPDSYDQLVSYVYEAAVSPHLAAQMEGNPVELSKVEADYAKAAARYDYVTMEGSGGIVCPIRWDGRQKIMLADIIKALDLPVLIVADGALGTINSVALTVAYTRAQGIPIQGILLNRFHRGDRMEEDNKVMIEALTGVPVVAVIGENETELDMDAGALAQLYE